MLQQFSEGDSGGASDNGDLSRTTESMIKQSTDNEFKEMLGRMDQQDKGKEQFDLSLGNQSMSDIDAQKSDFPTI